MSKDFGFGSRQVVLVQFPASGYFVRFLLVPFCSRLVYSWELLALLFYINEKKNQSSQSISFQGYPWNKQILSITFLFTTNQAKAEFSKEFLESHENLSIKEGRKTIKFRNSSTERSR